ncbi:hypothetical protein IW140_000763 [Coemansia sp. RSA 1813]|nr:hypothetical protein EV178_000731 [Coemansia sp. RSA 1646]KAJ1773633.1 hypothetical protein LPJ74_000549 [Coemansia sp. RSA 1843]KAJ2092351.1 hypothetical protein IW138_001113 [Coemansia sp. RSA 986]KAJ2217422.1 hypothetical protein EV179_000572 [Coemansia sp. RSA 487]KAJ2572648.1 hypothetical protein IW140_000763 [Coemansia sp. RSA 1813]
MITQKQRERSGGTPRRNPYPSDSEAATPRVGTAVSQERASTATKSIDRLQHQQQTGRVASLAMSGNIASLGTSDYGSGGGRNDTDEMDAIWDELDNMELDSQTMRQLTETEEQFYATQHFVESADLALSQEFTESKHDTSTGGRSVMRCTSADGGPAHGSRVVPHGPSTRSVPVTPSAPQPVYISDSDSSEYPSVEKNPLHEHVAGGAVRDRSGSLKYTNQHQQPQTNSHGHPNARMSSSRGKVNLYQRLAQHIPPRPGNDLAPPSKPSLTIQKHIGHSAQERNQQSQPKRYKPESLSISAALNPTIDLNTSSTLTPPSSRFKYHQTHANSTHRPNVSSSLLPASPNIYAHADQSGFAEEIERLRAENESMRAETDQLKAQLYTKDGEVRIVRDNLARTEISYTQLQEQLANQKSKSEAEHKLAEGKLQSEIDRLKTEMFFQQQEAQMAAISASGASATQTPRASRAPHAVKRANTAEKNTGIINAKPCRVVDYPTMEDFESPPNQKTTGSGAINIIAPDTPSPRVVAAKQDSQAGLQKAQPGCPSSATYQANSMLLEMLQSVVDQSDADFSNVVSLSIQLSSVAGDPSSTQINAFQSSVCNVLTKLAQEESYRQLSAVLRLLLRVLTTLDEFCATWLHDPAVCEAGAQTLSPLLKSTAATASVSVGNSRTRQLSAALNSTLRTTVRTASKLQPASSKNTSLAMAISLQCKLITRVISAQPETALSDKAWETFDPCLETTPLLTPRLHLDALVGVLEVVTVLIQVSPSAWRFIRNAPGNFEQFLMAAIRRLQRAFADNDSLVLDGERSLLVLIASAIVTHEDDTPMLVNGMKRFTTALVQWFIDEHQSLTLKSRYRGQLASSRRLQVFFEYTKCLNVVLSEVDDVAELLGGDNSPLFFAFVTTCTRMSIGEGAFVEISSMRELAADLLAYVVTEEQALSIQGLMA